MKMNKTIFGVLLAVILTFLMIPAALAQVVSPETTCQAGETVTVEFTYTNIKGMQATIDLSQTNILDVNADGYYYTLEANAGDDKIFLYPIPANNEFILVNVEGDVISKVTIKLTLKVSADALKDDSCVITIKGNYSEDGENYIEVDEQVTLKVVLDYTELNAAIANAEAEVAGDNNGRYTADSWNALKAEIDAAKAVLLNAKTQKEVDDAVASLKSRSLVAIDYAELNDAIADAEALLSQTNAGPKYDVNVWADLEAALAVAKAFKTEEQSEVADAANALRAAIQNVYNSELKYAELDAAIQAAKDQVAAQNAGRYTSTSWDAVKAAITAAETARASVKTQADIDNALAALQRVKLVAIVYDVLNDVIADAEALLNAGNDGKYDAAAWANLEAALAVAKAFKTEEQSEVAVAAAALRGAINAVTGNELIYDVLDEAIRAAKDQVAGQNAGRYTSTSWDAVKAAITAAETARASVKTQADIDNALAALQSVKLVAIDYAELNDAIADAEALLNAGNDGKYDAAAWANLEAALAVAKAFKTEEQSEVAGAADALRAAIQNVYANELDYAELDAVIGAANQHVAGEYTATSWKVLQEKLSAALLLQNNAQNQDAIDAATRALEDAISKLKLNYDVLQNLIDQINQAIDSGELVVTDYIGYTWVVLQDALSEAQAFIDGDMATNYGDILDMKNALESALSQLTLQGDGINYNVLKAYLGYINSLNPEDYSASSWNNLQKVVAKAQAMYDNKSAKTQKEINDMVSELNDALRALGWLLDYSELINAIAAAQDGKLEKNYTSESWAAMLEKLDAAIELNGNARYQAEIDKAAAALWTAIENLVDLTELNDILDQIENELVADDYTTSTWNELLAAIAAIDAVKENGTKDEVNAAIKQLNDAIDALLNISTLKEAIAAGEATLADGKEYTEESKKALQEVIEAGKTLYYDCTAEQAEETRQAIIAAIDALVEKPVEVKPDSTKLDAAIEAAGKLNKNDYTEESWNALQKVLEEISKATLDSQSAVDLAEATVKAAIDALVEKPVEVKPDSTKLDAAIEAAGKLNKNDYTEESWNALQKVLEEISKATLDSQSAVDLAEATVKAAIDALVEKPVEVVIDRADLDAAINAVTGLNKNDYTAESWKALEDVLAEVNGATYDSQAAIDMAVVAVNAAKNALVKKESTTVDLDYAGLNAAIEMANGLTEADYTAETWAALKSALDAATALINAADTQAEIDDATAALVAAVKALEKVTTTIVEPGTKPIWYALMWVSVAVNAAAATLVVVYFIMKNKKQKDNVPMVDYSTEDDENNDSNEAN